MNKTVTPAELCSEACDLLRQSDAMKRLHGECPPRNIQLLMDQMAMTAENLAGEAGFLAARLGMAAQVPSPAEGVRVLSSAFLGSYALEDDGLWGGSQSPDVRDTRGDEMRIAQHSAHREQTICSSM